MIPVYLGITFFYVQALTFFLFLPLIFPLLIEQCLANSDKVLSETYSHKKTKIWYSYIRIGGDMNDEAIDNHPADTTSSSRG